MGACEEFGRPNWYVAPPSSAPVVHGSQNGAPAGFKSMLPSQGSQASVASKTGVQGAASRAEVSPAPRVVRIVSDEQVGRPTAVAGGCQPNGTSILNEDVHASLNDTLNALRGMNEASVARTKASQPALHAASASPRASRAAPGTGTTGRTAPGRSGIARSANPAPFTFPSAMSSVASSVDSYFSSKLSRTIADLTKSTDLLRETRAGRAPGHADGLVFKFKSRRFKVGKAESRSPSEVSCFRDRMEYCFVRESIVDGAKDHIAMVMYYKDMVSPKVTPNFAFLFKVPRALHFYFQDYEPENEHHTIKLNFERERDCEGFKTKVLPIIRKFVPMR